MNTDDFVKIILAVSVSFAIVGLAFVLMRFISKLSEVVDDIRRPVKNIAELSDLTLNDYKDARSFIKSVFDISTWVKEIAAMFQSDSKKSIFSRGDKAK
jgi:hypothetical protein